MIKNSRASYIMELFDSVDSVIKLETIYQKLAEKGFGDDADTKHRIRSTVHRLYKSDRIIKIGAGEYRKT